MEPKAKNAKRDLSAKREPRAPKAAKATKGERSAKAPIQSAIVIERAVCIFAAQAIIGIESVKNGKAGLSEQLWAGLSKYRKVEYADEVGKEFDRWLEHDASQEVKSNCAKWRSGGYLANMLKNCRRIAEHAVADPSIWGCLTFNEAWKRVTAADKAAKEAAEPKGGAGKVEFDSTEYILQIMTDLDSMEPAQRAVILSGLRGICVQYGVIDADTLTKAA